MNDIFLTARTSTILRILAFVTGSLAVQHFPALPSASITFFVACSGGLFWYRRQRMLACVLFGIGWAIGYGQLHRQDMLPLEWEGQDLIIEGSIVGIPQKLEDGSRFDFAVRAVAAPEQARVPQRIRLNWYRAQTELKAGGDWRLTVRLKRPHGFFNPGGMDFEQWLFAQGIGATGYVRDSTENRMLRMASNPLSAQIWRQGLYDRLIDAVGWSELSGIIVALTLGEEGDISPEQWEVLRKTGTLHLVAISGSHIGLIAGLVFFLVCKICTLLLLKRWPPPTVAAWTGLIAAVAYAALADFAIPTQRALIMVAMVMGSIIARRNLQAGYTLALALLAVTLHDPLAVVAPGFWLSFGAVALILLIVSGRLRRMGWTKELWTINWVTALGLAPLLLLFFQQVSMISPLANLLAVPTLGLIAVPLCLGGALLLPLSPEAGTLVLTVAEKFLRSIWPILQCLADVPGAQWHHLSPPLWTLAFALPGVLLLISPRGIPARWLGLVLLLPALSANQYPPPPGGYRFTLLDVGQGLASVVETRNHVLVFDTGARFGNHFNLGSAVIEPFLHQHGIEKIDTLIVSHGDNDHIGGAFALLRHFPVALTYTSVPERLSEAAPQPCRAGQFWDWDGIRFEMLSPFHSLSSENDNSCVLKVGTAPHCVVLTGDVEKSAELALSLRIKDRLRCDVLIAPHHGSKTSSSAELLDAVRPRFVLIPAGYRNRYGFPHRTVMERYRGIGASVLNTAEAGAISFVAHEKTGIGTPDSYRQSHGKYWNDRPND